MKNLTSAGDHDKISKVIEMLIKEFAKSPQANHRKVLHLDRLFNICIYLDSRVFDLLDRFS